MHTVMQHPLSRFLARIWKRVYRNIGTCNCSGCRDVEKNGLIISTKMHADYLFNCQTDYVDGKIVPWNEYRDKQ